MNSFQKLKISIRKAATITLFFALVHLLYNFEIIRINVEDIGFDITNKLFFEKVRQNTKSPKIMVFAIDDLYLEKKGLLSEDSNTNYGYSFPRDKIAQFISDLDELSSLAEKQNIPKALFIDYDFSYTSLPYGKNLSNEDKTLLDILKKKRPYSIFLPKIQSDNFIEQSEDLEIQKLIAENKINFVSVLFLESKDVIARRYVSFKKYKNSSKEINYPNAAIALWQFSNDNKINTTSILKEFQEKDIISNRIFIKSYMDNILEEDCLSSQSYWNNYIKYSAECSLFEIIEEDFSQALIMLGGTYSNNQDEFNVLNVGKSRSIKGIELHANSLMSMFFLKGQLTQLKFIPSVFIIFFLFITIDFFISIFLQSFFQNNKKLYFIVMFAITVSVLLPFSLFMIFYKSIWFNWFVPIVIYQIFGTFDNLKEMFRTYSNIREFLIRLLGIRSHK